MAHTLQITDGTTFVTLSSNGMMLQHYVPRDAQANESGSYDPVVDSIDVAFVETTTTNIQLKKRTLDRLLERANRRAATGKGGKIWLYYKPHNETVTWRSEIIRGTCTLAPDAMTAFVSAVAKMTITITRSYFWEGDRTALQLNNSHGNSTTGVRIYSHDDSTHDNHVLIASGAVAGNLPAPLEISLKNDSGSSYNSRNWYIGNNSYDDSAVLIVQGETDTSGSSVSAATESNGAYRSYNTASAYPRYTIPAATVNAFSGRWAKVMLKMSSFSTSAGISDLYVQPVLMDKFALVTIYAGNEVLLKKSEDYFQDLGNIPLPPGNIATDWESMVLGLNIRTQDGIAEFFGIDFVYLLPVDEVDKAYRHIEQRGMVLLANSEIVDDGIEGDLYFYEASKRHPILIGRGNPVHVIPGLAQRIHFLFDGEGSTVNWTYSVKAYYRPRRLSI